MSESVNELQTVKKSKRRKNKKPLSKKKKILLGAIALILVAAIIVGSVFFAKSKKTESTYSYIRTTTLAKGTLEDSVSVTGTVESAQTSNVTTDLSYAVKNIAVSVGDEVKKGDTICTLDTADLEEEIEREKSTISSNKKSARSSYDSALTSYNNAKSSLSSAKSSLDDAKGEKEAAAVPYNTAKSAVKSYQDAYETALDNYNSAGSKYVKALSNYTSALSKYKNKKISASKLASAAKSYMKAVYNYYGGCTPGSYDISDSSSSSGGESDQMASQAATSSSDTVTVTKTAARICSGVSSEVYSLCKKRVSCSSGSNTLKKLSDCAKNLKSAKTAANYNSLESAYTSAKSSYTSAKSTYNQAKSELQQAQSQLSQAKEQLSSASTSDTLEELEKQLEECTITANQDGTVTSLNAVVGSSAGGSATASADSAAGGGSSAGSSGTVASISNLDKLKVSVTIPEADINKATVGMSCYITSDASDDTLDGTLTQLDPTADSDNTFGAEVTVDTSTSDLKIGMNASVELVVSSKDNVYQVPIDAVGTDDSIGSFVYRKVSGEGTDMQFEKVAVTTGDKNDYYIEISSSDLSEGDVIRSSSDLSEGIDTTSKKSTDSSNSNSLFGNFGSNSAPSGGDMPGGGGSGGPSGGGGGAPGGGSNGK